MAYCPVCGKEIVSNPQWVYYHPLPRYATQINRIGANIFFLRVESDKPVVLEQFEEHALKKALDDAGLKPHQPFHVIWNLERVEALSYAYKQDVANFLYNKQPPLRSTVFYHIGPEFLSTAERIHSILPSSMSLCFAKDYNEAIRITLEQMTEHTGETNNVNVATDEYELLKHNFLRASTMIGWLHLLDENIPLPPPDHDLYPFFKALVILQEALRSKEALHKDTIADLKKTCNEKLHVLDTGIARIKSETQKALQQSEQETTQVHKKPSLLDAAICKQRAPREKQDDACNTLVFLVNSLTIASEQKKRLLDYCETLRTNRER